MIKPTNKQKRTHKKLDKTFWHLAEERKTLLTKMDKELDPMKRKAYNGKITAITKKLVNASTQFNYSRNITKIG